MKYLIVVVMTHENQLTIDLIAKLCVLVKELGFAPAAIIPRGLENGIPEEAHVIIWNIASLNPPGDPRVFPVTALTNTPERERLLKHIRALPVSTT